MKGLLRNLSLTLGSLLLVLLLLELGLRLFYPQNPILIYEAWRQVGALFEPDPLLGHKLVAGYQRRIATPEYAIDIRINSLGLRGPEVPPKAPGEFRILGLGDSFTFGQGVEERETYLAVLGEQLRGAKSVRSVRVINAGVPGYGQGEEYRFLKAQGQALQPDLVLVGLLIGNDLGDNAAGPQRFTVVEGRLYSTQDVQRGISPLGRVRNFFRDYSHLYHFVGSRWNRVRKLLNPDEEASPSLPGSMLHLSRLCGVEGDPEVERAWQITGGFLRGIRDEARKQGAPLVLVLIPGLEQVVRSYWPDNEAACQRFGLAYEPRRQQDQLLAVGERLDIPVVDLLPAFVEADPTVPFYYPIDAHWTPAGHRLAAQEIYRFLMENNLVAP